MESGYPSAESVLDELGDKVVEAVALATVQVRDDLRVYQATFPQWAADHTDRGLLNIAHDRAWAHMTRLLDDVPGVTLDDRIPTREIYVGSKYRARWKKHDDEGVISTYPTQTALLFMEQDQQATLDGLEEVRLCFGYLWDEVLREIGAPVISLRDGERLIWIERLEEPADPAIVHATPIVPPPGPVPPTVSLRRHDDTARPEADTR